MDFLWHTILYDPILNALIALYNGPALQNLGIALIELTVLIRIFLLPLNLISFRAARRYDALHSEIQVIESAHRNDSVRRREKIRGLLKIHRINPWAKAVMVAAQGLVLLVLYRVFVNAIRHNDFNGLYAWNYVPDFLNRNFLGFDLAAHSILWAAAVGLVLYIEIWFEQRRSHTRITSSDLIYRLVFPGAFLLAFYLLPTGKSVFILTSLLLSLMIDGVVKVVRHRGGSGS